MDSLVSIIVLTYNSSKYVIETLESIKAQTYDRIELVITDDCSTDETPSICQMWLERSKNRFINSTFVGSSQNTGVSANANRGVRASHGRWIKLIAGDDRLMPNCISDSINYVDSHPDTEFLFSNVRTINSRGTEIYGFISKINAEVFNALSPVELRTLLYVTNVLPAPTSFIKRDTLVELGLYDENFPMKEDYPLWLKAVSGSKIIKMLNQPTVEYRIHAASISASSKITSYSLHDKLFQKYRYKLLMKESLLLWYFGYTSFMFNRKRNFFYSILFSLNKVNPYYYKYSFIFSSIKANETD